MFPATTTRRLACMLPRLRAASLPSFHTSRPGLVNVGDRIPDLTVLVENSPGNKVNLSQELERGLIIGVPAAFSTSEVSHLNPTKVYASHFINSHGIQRIQCNQRIPLTNHVFVSPKSPNSISCPVPRSFHESAELLACWLACWLATLVCYDYDSLLF